ncbi:MAG: family 78 glycoside hydrolase catalytic domain [Kiritimatiellales bacterium]
MKLTDLCCGYRINPLAVELDHPELSWKLASTRQDAAQIAWQIQASSSEQTLDDAELWKSRWVRSSQTAHIRYAGKSLSFGGRIWWRVRIKDETGTVSEWSAPAWFGIGLKNDEEWQGAKWIACTYRPGAQMAPADIMGPWIADAVKSPDMHSLTFSTSFTVPDKSVVYAGAYWGTAVPAVNDCSVNGKSSTFRFRDNSPMMTEFSFCVKPGSNQIELYLPNTPCDNAVTFGMRIVFADETEQIIRSSPDWSVAVGAASPKKEKVLGEKSSLDVICDYGQEPLGEAKVCSTAPLPVMWYKTDFDLKKKVDSAQLYICGLGYNEPYLNGRKIGDHVLDPGQTDYDQEALYQAFDVTQLLLQGRNALSVLLGDGWYGEDRAFGSLWKYGTPGLRALLQIRYDDGSVENIVSDKNWKWSESKTRMSNLYLGGHVDFRKETDEWKTPGFSKHWKPVQIVAPRSPKLRAQDFPPIRKIRTIDPAKVWQAGEKTWCADLGQNISGWVRLKLNEPDGTVVRVRCTERLLPDGKHLDNVPFSFWRCHAAPQHSQLICDGKPHTWEPHFSYHGFRYFEVFGLSHPPQPGDLTGVVVHTDVPVTASFESSDPLLNRIF